MNKLLLSCSRYTGNNNPRKKAEKKSKIKRNADENNIKNQNSFLLVIRKTQ